MTSEFKQKIEELKKGCGKDLNRKSFDGDIDLYCGIEIFISEKIGLRNVYCPECNAKIKAIQEGYELGKKEAQKIHEDWKEEFIKKLKEASENNDWEVATDGGEKDGFLIISGVEFIDKLAGDLGK